ncbi:penicillin-binding transpeptidase domain-containing protein [Nocardioides convexus]|uniref:penicillin-binding transpeptidase domain-containing protein n=1 Tax=Nocardioides convexus TaxID=2712224 RepID=UPI00241877AE|nr:penicillin-binding transpeptidase domain-containing protein [Nocardioides convexus]
MVKKDPSAYRSGDIAGLTGLQARYDEQAARHAWPRRLRRAGGQGRRAPRGSSAASRPPASRSRRRSTPACRPSPSGCSAPCSRPARWSRSGPATARSWPPPTARAPAGRTTRPTGRLAPGSTFKSVTSLALLRAGLTPQTPVRCTPTVTVNGKQFKNYSDYPASAVGTIPLQEAIAQSCNTALINARAKVKDGALADAAGSLGLGIDHDLGFPAYFGKVPAKPASETEGAANLIGQGKVLASPMAMATVVASIQAGKTVVPHLVAGTDVSVPAAAKPLTAAEARQAKALLRRVVTDGSGRGLADLPGGPVIAKTGTAEYADAGTIRTHAWMIAAQGDLAVAVFVQTGTSGSQTAGPLLEEFLRGAR